MSLNDSITKTATVNYTDNGTAKIAVFARVGNIVTMFMQNLDSRTFSAWQQTELFTIPTGYRPTRNVRFSIVQQSTPSATSVCYCVQADGKFLIENQSGTQYASGAIFATFLTWHVL